MSDASCPHCDAPSAREARRCARCGYSFVEGGGAAPVRLPRRALATVGLGAAVALAAAVAIVALGGERENESGDPADGLRTVRRLEVISERPLRTAAAERALEELFVAPRDDDTAAVRCSRREARPAHSVRRCRIRYPSGIERRIVVITNAGGTEVLSEP